MKIKRIDLFTFPNAHQYGVQQAFSEGLQKSLERLGVASSLYPYKELGAGSVLAALVQNSPDYTVGFNVTVGQYSPLEPLGIPHLAIIIDLACYFPELFRNQNALAAFVDEDSVGFYKMLSGKNAIYLPHAIDKELIVEQNSKRDLDIVMCGSFMDAEDIANTWDNLLSEKNASRMRSMAECVLASSHISPLQVFVEEVNAKGEFEKELLDKAIDYFDLLTSLDQYIRGIDRIRILQAIERPIHIFGPTSWKKYLQNAIFHPEVPYKEVHTIFRRSKIIINSFPMFKRGLHERLLLALASGASVLHNKNLAVQQAFGELLPYLAPDYKGVNASIETALSDEEARYAKVSATHTTIKSQHTWDERAKQLITFLSTLKN